jgi:hypothetical protein
MPVSEHKSNIIFFSEKDKNVFYQIRNEQGSLYLYVFQSIH